MADAAARLRRTAASFDASYTAADGMTGRHELFRAALGLPDWVQPNSFVTASAFDELAAALRVGPGKTLVDLACGRGGPGLLVAGLTGARLHGVDLSPVAVGQSAARAAAHAPAVPARFSVGRLDASGLPGGSVDAVLCVDALHFAPDWAAAAAEAYRLLKPGGRYVQTSWEPAGPSPEGADGPHGRYPDSFRDLLDGAGFRVLDVQDRPDLLAAERAVFEAAVAAPDPGEQDGPLAGLRAEAEFVLPWIDRTRRVLVIAERPADR